MESSSIIIFFVILLIFILIIIALYYFATPTTALLVGGFFFLILIIIIIIYAVYPSKPTTPMVAPGTAPSQQSPTIVNEHYYGSQAAPESYYQPPEIQYVESPPMPAPQVTEVHNHYYPQQARQVPIVAPVAQVGGRPLRMGGQQQFQSQGVQQRQGVNAQGIPYNKVVRSQQAGQPVFDPDPVTRVRVVPGQQVRTTAVENGQVKRGTLTTPSTYQYQTIDELPHPVNVTGGGGGGVPVRYYS
jgi:hypothetical protein